MNLEQMRQNYALGGLRKRDMASDPMVQFDFWLKEALQDDLPDWFEVNAMTLSTSDTTGKVSSRIVLLKGVQDNKFWFYTNYDSDKGQQMAANEHVSLCLHWPHLQRQVRIDGTVEKSTREQSVEYFHSRPRDSQLGAVASSQSRIVENRDVLESAMSEAAKEYGDGTVACPKNWGGYGVTPDAIEFWQGRASRLHDRMKYSRENNQWTLHRLSP